MKKIDENISIGWFIVSITGGICLIFLSYYLSTKYSIETSLTAFVAVLGAVPTAYLWIVKEKKKEKELQNKDKEFQNKDKELTQQKITELNKVYVDAINQFYETKSLLAGAYALEALLYSRSEMLDNIEGDKAFINIKLQQISSILFSLNNYDDFDNKKIANSYFKITGRIVSFIATNIKSNQINSFDWENYDASHSYLENVNLDGVDLENALLNEAVINHSILDNANLTDSDLTGASLVDADLRGTDLAGATIVMADLTGAFLYGTSLKGANLTGSNLTDAEFEGAIINETVINKNLSAEQAKKASFKHALFNEELYSQSDYIRSLSGL